MYIHIYIYIIFLCTDTLQRETPNFPVIQKEREGSSALDVSGPQKCNGTAIAQLLNEATKVMLSTIIFHEETSFSELLLILLMVQKSGVHHLECIKPCK